MATAVRAGATVAACCCTPSRLQSEAASTSAACRSRHVSSLSCGEASAARALPLIQRCLSAPPQQQLQCAASRRKAQCLARLGRPASVSVSVSASVSASASAVADQSTSVAEGGEQEESGKILLEVKGLTATIADGGKEILKGVDLVIREGEVHAIMGKNGSGKSTLSKVLVGHPDYEVTGGMANYKGQNLFEMEPEERSHAGLFLSFQSPVEIPGVSNTDFLRMACNARRAAQGLPEMDPLEFYGFLTPKLENLNMDISYLQRNVNEGFSGGEKKRNEILQLAVLEANMAILDEIDSGLDIDALKDVANAVKGLRGPQNAVLMITHYQRLLDYIEPDFVHIMEAGKIVRTGDKTLAKELEVGGYAALKS